ncbi:MAG: type VI secretion system tip protein VgrG [Porphyromonadaceae bacterium]|nr:type VI secretion system tip protein VgrG [Porphyromonadaceae bacterium]
MDNTGNINDSNNTILDFKVFIDGNNLTEVADVIAIGVHKQFCKIPTAEVVLHYGSMLNNEYIDVQNDFIAIGNEIEIVYNDGDLSIFKGVIVKKSVSVSNKKSLLKLTAKNNAYKMTQNRYNHVFAEKKDSEIIEDIIKKYSFDCDIDSTSYTNETDTQYNCSDWDFINIKAERNSLLIFADDDKITVKQPKVSSATLAINGYNSIIDFDAQLDGRTAFTDYKATSWNYNSQERQEVEQPNSSSNFTQGSQQTKELAEKLNNDSFNININSYFADNELIAKKANAAIMRNNLSRIIGKVKLYGLSEIKPGDTVEFSGIGDSFNGNAFVTEVAYDFVGGAWSTSIGFGMEETSYYWSYDDVNAAPAAELSPAVNGLQVGKVVALEGDPTDEFRIKVALPCFEGDPAEVWARVASPDAGKERGYHFFPEIDDEVVIGFIDQNPNNPIILGALFSNKLPAKQPLSDNNNVKGLYLKSGIKMEFNEEDKIITIETPGNNKLIMNDKDSIFEITDANGNKIVMDNQGINIKSAGKITLEAYTDLSIKGVNMTAEASASLKASGSASAEISSSGVLAVKGSLVQIN